MKVVAIVFLVAVLLTVNLNACAAQTWFSGLTAGKMSVSFNSGADRISVSYGGVRLIRDGSLWVHNPEWNKHYYGMTHIKDDIKIVEIAGGKEATVLHRTDAFYGVEKIRVVGNKVEVEFTFKLLQDIKDADMEYCFGNFVASSLIGKPFKAQLNDGTVQEGSVPIYSKEGDLMKSALTSKPFKSISFSSRIGKLTIETSGDPGEMTMHDSRKHYYEPIDKHPSFWVGVLGIHLEFGKEYTYRASLTVDPLVSVCPTKKVEQKVKTLDVKLTRRPAPSKVVVIPEPQEMKTASGAFELNEGTEIVVGKDVKELDLEGARSFAEEVSTLYGLNLKVVREGTQSGKPAIYVGEARLNKALAGLAARSKVKAPIKEEGYYLLAAPKEVLVIGSDRRGSYYGMQTLKQLLVSPKGKAAIQCCAINDWPSLKFRAVHLFVSSTSLAFHEKLIDKILSRYKFNCVMLEVDYMNFSFLPSPPAAFSASPESVRKEVQCAKEHLMDVYPVFATLGHCDAIFAGRKNLDLAENPDKPYAYCPSQPRLYPFLFKFFDDMYEVFDHPKVIHIGHDEVLDPEGFPRCPECIKKPLEKHFIDDVNKIREHIAAKGAKVAVWGDMMLFKGSDPDAMNATSEAQAQWMRDNLPKDVIVTDWHYEPGKPEQFKSLKLFMDTGHDTIAASWFTPANIEAFSKQAKNVGALGLLQTTWCGWLSDETAFRDSFNQFSAMVLAGEYAWNSGNTPLDKLPYKADEEFRKQWDPIPVKQQQASGFVVDLSKAYNAELGNWLEFGVGNSLKAVPTGDAWFGTDLFRLARDSGKPSAIRLASSLDGAQSHPKAASILIGRKASKLLFLHTTAWVDDTNRNIGTYRIKYADGTDATIDIRYGDNVISWTDQRSIQGAIRCWEGLTPNGEKVSLHRLEWTNPFPAKEIKSIELISACTEAGVAVLGITGLK